ncbi:MAG TPA: hypothetical protein ENO06_00665 [Methanolinea sp.]|nr:hypothetical protein [Methanolinea sp.]
MEKDLFSPQPGYEAEFWKRYRVMKAMLSHLHQQEVLLSGLKREQAIPESARDMAIRAVEGEISANRKVFHDFLVNFINYGAQGLHRMDIDIGFALISGVLAENRHCSLHVEGFAHTLPPDIGTILMEKLVDMAGGGDGSLSDRIIEVYKKIEGHYDIVSGGDLGRCSLSLTEELFPSRCYHVRIRFPARILQEEDFIRLQGL